MWYLGHYHVYHVSRRRIAKYVYDIEETQTTIYLLSQYEYQGAHASGLHKHLNDPLTSLSELSW